MSSGSEMPYSSEMTRSRRAAFIGIVCIVAALVGLAAGEVWLRLRTPGRVAIPFYNRLTPYVMFHPRENVSYVTPTTYDMSHHQRGVAHYTNEDGFRVPAPGYRIARTHPPGQLRIAVLGGSAVQMGSTWEDTLPGSLRAVLRKAEPGRDIEVINGGIVSAISRQSVAELVFTVSPYQPDVVIVYDGYNDLFLPITYESRPNYPYNFQTMEDAWNAWRDERQDSLWRLMLSRSYVFNLLSRAAPANTAAQAAEGFYMGANALRPQQAIDNPALVKEHVARYLDNWRTVIALAAAYHYRPVCVLQPTAGLDRAWASAYIAHGFAMRKDDADRWVAAFALFYQEADRQVRALQAQYPGVHIVSMAGQHLPARSSFWDLVHVYDEVNTDIATRIYQEIRPDIATARHTK
jgi:lysophospholipase L1-like esterase